MFVFSGPAEVRGRFEKLRVLLHPLLIAFFVLLPWIKINNEPVILFDILHRNFVIFGSIFHSHDAPLLFFLVILLLLTIFMVTAVFGRLWCGWTCPQTVFIQGLFNKIEKLILGSYTKRVLLFRADDTFNKKLRVMLVLVSFFVMSWILAHSFGAYFLGTDAVTKYIIEGPGLHLQSFIILMIITTVLFLNFSFFRERVCVNICPYGRFQNALIDSNSLVIHYDSERGEPRGKATRTEKARGACVDCNRCVTVCPMKIDIRQGFQMECIACARCIDACDEVMAKTNSAPNLIRYQTGDQKPLTLQRFRLFLYAGLFLFFSGFLVWSLSQRNSVELNLARSHSIPFSTRMENEKKILQNQIIIHLKNQTETEQQIHLSLSADNVAKGFRLLSPAVQMQLHPGEDLKTVAFVEINESQYDVNSRIVVINLKVGALDLSKSIEFVKVDQ